MTFSNAERTAARGLSAAAGRLLDRVEAEPRLAERATFEPFYEAALEAVPRLSGLPAGERYGIQPWPVLLGPARVREFERAATGLARLVRGLPRRLFRDDPGEIARFFAVSGAEEAALLLAEPSGVDATLCRGDFVDTPRGLRCIEINFGPVGGWQHVCFAPLLARVPELAPFLAGEGGAGWRDSIGGLFGHVARDLLASGVPHDGALNLLVVASDGGTTPVESHPREVYRRRWREALGAEAGGMPGEAEVAAVSELRYPDGVVRARGCTFQGVVEQNEDEPGRELFRIFKAGRIGLYTGPVGVVLGDKRNLALLSKLGESPRFSDGERELIRRYVPWTRLLADGETEYRGRRVPILELARTARAELVLKAGHSFGGADVVIGRSVGQPEWEAAVERAAAAGGWVVQEYCPPVDYPFQHGEAGWCPHAVVWGLYVFGDRFGGVFVRLAPRAAGEVLNVARGARIGVAFEVPE